MNDIVDRIARGEATLLGIDDICARLGISRTTFDRWVKNGAAAKNPASRGTRSLFLKPENVAGLPAADTAAGMAARFGAGGIGSPESAESAMTFPPADIRIGNSPKWEMATFKKWLLQNAKPAQ